MTYDEALHEAIAGARVTHAAFQPGVYIEHSFSRGFIKCWPVDKPEDEPQRTQCDFRANADDVAATWQEVERPALAVDNSPVDAWGRSTPAAIVASWGTGKPATQNTPEYVAAVDKLIGAKPKPEPVEFCGECDFVKTACVCPKPAANKWGPGKSGPGK